MKYFIIAGEASGDLHGANLVRALQQADPEAQIWAWGGDLMEQAGAQLLKHYRSLAFMGFWEVITHLRTIWKNMRLCKQQLLDVQPDALILIDYPGFNLRMAKFAKAHHIRTFYYISPKVWAWKQSRVQTIKENIERLFVIFPFEVEFYQRFNYEVEYVGNPLNEQIANTHYNPRFLTDHGLSEAKERGKVIALLPGSRLQEIRRILPEMLRVSTHFPDSAFVVAAAPSIDAEVYQQFLNPYPHIRLIYNQTYDLLNNADAALVTSGTATLETALHNVPQVVCYKANPISVAIARMFIKNIKYISLVNLIANKKIVTELIQNQLNEVSLVQELREILEETEIRLIILDNYRILKTILKKTNSSNQIAMKIVSLLKREIG